MTRTIVRFDPFAGLDMLQRDLLDDRFFRALRGNRLPTTDVYTEDDKALIVEAHLPNFAEEDISVDVDGGTLVIQAERHERDDDKHKKYVVRESSSSFYRSIALPDRAQEEQITAAFDDGVLKVTVPLGDTSSARNIAITRGAGDNPLP
jgi:HSP20 family protein